MREFINIVEGFTGINEIHEIKDFDDRDSDEYLNSPTQKQRRKEASIVGRIGNITIREASNGGVIEYFFVRKQQPIGKALVIQNRDGSVYVKRIWFLPSERQQGIGYAFYLWMIKDRRFIVQADSQHTTASKALWAKLARDGYVHEWKFKMGGATAQEEIGKKVKNTKPYYGNARGLVALAEDVQTKSFSPEFKRWFGNSKVVDEHGQPERVFHGTAASIDRFQHTGNGAGSRESRLGYWFTENTDAAAQFAAFARPNGAGSNIVPVYLSIQRPWLPESYGEIMDLIDRHTAFARKMDLGGRNIRMVGDRVDYAGAIAELRSQGYDGIILRNTLTDAPSDGERINQYIILSPNQAKSVFNAGGYDPHSDHLSEETLDEVMWASDMDHSTWDRREGRFRDDQDFKPVGKFGKYTVALTSETLFARDKIYVIFDGDKRVGYLEGHPENTDNHSFRAEGLVIDPSYRGKNIPIEFYHWLLGHYTYIHADDMQTDGGMSVWARMVMDPRFEVEAENTKTEEFETVTDPKVMSKYYDEFTSDWDLWVTRSKKEINEVNLIGDFDDQLNSERKFGRWEDEIKRAKVVGKLGDKQLKKVEAPEFGSTIYFLMDGKTMLGRASVSRDIGFGYLKIGHIWFDPSVRGKGYGLGLYSFLIDAGNTLVSDYDQTRHSKALWQRLAKKYVVRPYLHGMIGDPVTDLEPYYGATNNTRLIVSKT